MTKTVLQLRCTDSEKVAWLAAGGSIWIRETLNAALGGGERLESRSLCETFVEPVAAKPSSPPSVAVPEFAFSFKPDPKANVKEVKQALSNAGPCIAFAPRGTKCKLCGKSH